ncbi:hypothetical protein EB796_006578 [Bugula neritina]|uniref:Uncharacterized protein n=1 Tax=Bugula neritina TaxID=10212 RepID=A0A7J7K905_BUGNE|nr:hypothetical protein EB796_006578 [Bugula neritina]
MQNLIKSSVKNQVILSEQLITNNRIINYCRWTRDTLPPPQQPHYSPQQQPHYPPQQQPHYPPPQGYGHPPPPGYGYPPPPGYGYPPPPGYGYPPPNYPPPTPQNNTGNTLLGKVY